MNITLHRNTINHEEQQTVNARELHAFLEVGKDFSTWIKERIEQYGFIENQDFVIFTEIGKNQKEAAPVLNMPYR
ncbi:antA/AntB antirepressor family protein [Neisseria sp. MVDL20-010259]|nr:antA/AntB antirepressor family protein [Neisseria sp. MVDL20-010259]MDO1563505.1 antA/AntB antirepressor family protein [Neisseria sp. MVDL20-010259]